MVVLDTNFGMLSSSNSENHYIIPDPITLPPTVRIKKYVLFINFRKGLPIVSSGGGGGGFSSKV